MITKQLMLLRDLLGSSLKMFNKDQLFNFMIFLNDFLIVYESGQSTWAEVEAALEVYQKNHIDTRWTAEFEKLRRSLARNLSN